MHPLQTSFLSGPNAAFIAELYARYAEDPDAVAPDWRRFFADLPDDARAVLPAIKEATGFFMWALINRAASSSADPPISPIITTAEVLGSSLKSFRQSTKLVPLTGSPPMPMQVDCPMPRLVS